jgi:hypothetical protein
VGADPAPAPPKEQCGMRNGECGMDEPKAPQIRKLKVTYIRRLPQAQVFGPSRRLTRTRPQVGREYFGSRISDRELSRSAESGMSQGGNLATFVAFDLNSCPRSHTGSSARPSHAVGWPRFLDPEADGTPRLPRRGHELTNGLEHRSELRVILLLKVFQLPRQVAVRRQHAPGPDEGPHDLHWRHLDHEVFGEAGSVAFDRAVQEDLNVTLVRFITGRLPPACLRPPGP